MDDLSRLEEERNMKEKRLALLKKGVSSLCEKCKQVLELSWSDKTMSEVADIMGVSSGFARKIKCQCKAELIKLIKNDPEFNSLKW
jgi:DNA-directed RNA polymerase specialized sigma subunit